jgi:hypothetical protein
MKARQVNGWIVGIIAGGVAWSAAASALWCYGTGVCRPGEWPLLQWWFVAPFWRENWYVTLWVVVSALAPTIGTLFAAWAAWMWFRRKPKPPLHGETQWDKQARPQGAISTTRRPF